MKKAVIYLSLILLVGVLSCRREEKKQTIISSGEEDTIALVDTQQEAAEEAAKAEAEQAAAEQAKQDSIRQDSIKKVEKAIASIPTFYEFEKNSYRGKFFKSRGFDVVEKHIYVHTDLEDYYDVKATFNPANGISCTFKNDYGGYGGFSITINGAPEVLNKIYENAKSFVRTRNKQYRSEGSEEFGEVSLKNNTVTIQYYNIGS